MYDVIQKVRHEVFVVISSIFAYRIIVSSLFCHFAFQFFISLGILTLCWEFSEHNLGNLREPGWKH